MIYTFYANQSGIGRSMALANVAECLYMQGLKVIVVDWDLESPGLESFFFEPTDEEGVEGSESSSSLLGEVVEVPSRLGLVDMLIEYRRSFDSMPASAQELPVPEKTADFSRDEKGPEPAGGRSDARTRAKVKAQAPHSSQEFAAALDDRIPSLFPYLVPVRPDDLESLFGHDGSIALLPAGLRSDEHPLAYAQAIRSLDCDELYASYRGKQFIDWLRGKLLQAADVILIDAPSSTSGVGGLCTNQLADVVVCFCAPSEQDLDSVAGLVEQLRSAETRDARDHRPLETMVVPVYASESEPEELGLLERRFARFSDNYSLPLPLQEQGLRFWDLRMPYRPQLSLRERLVIRGEGGGTDAPEPLESAYWTLALRLSLFAPQDHEIRRQFAGPTQETVPTPATPPASSHPAIAPPPVPLEQLEEMKNASVVVAAILNVGYTTSTNNDAFPSRDGQLGIGSDHSDETAAYRAEEGSVMPGESGPPPQGHIPRRAGVEPSVPPVAGVAGPTGTGFRISPAWGSLAVALFMLGTVALLASRAARNARAAAANQTALVPPALTAERKAPTPIAPVASASSQPPADEQANHAAAPVDAPKSKPFDVDVPKSRPIDALPQEPSPQPGSYLRVGLGPPAVCPAMLTYGRQFLASGMADSKVVQLKSGACALVRGPYPADIVQQRRKEHNDRHIRGFDTAVVVDGSDFDKWLLGM